MAFRTLSRGPNIRRPSGLAAMPDELVDAQRDEGAPAVALRWPKQS
ncbi:MAG TPA: hypothetical protein VMB50_11530 [Myxococcales bacterium]|nr:hypothetical protein [Myxococcales bacterium]